MFRKTLALLLTPLFILSLTSCGNTSSAAETTSKAEGETQTESTESKEAEESGAETTIQMGRVSNTIAEDEEALIAEYCGKFEQKTYADEESGLSITYNLYLPENYDEAGTHPMVVFIGDSSCVGDDPTVSLTQGRGALVWATKEWQEVYPTIVAVPTYPETILDDHGSYITTEYVELTKRYIDYMADEYAVDKNRIYGTGQSMGCMTTLILSSKYPGLYAGCMFVDGQWDINTLAGLKDQTFVYFAAEDDTNAWNGAGEVMEMFDKDSVEYKYAQWDGNYTPDELSSAAAKLFTSDGEHYFISWKTGTIEPVEMGAGGGFGGGNGTPPAGGPGNMEGAPSGPPSAEGESSESMSAGINSSSYHMASFDYAYNCIAVMEWLFSH
ncbi:MAG: hypothetical protein K6F99_07000 [Lachnospiraceae bacterium]|nr:hypothetical protein [Lachnospiraceae bacterium]